MVPKKCIAILNSKQVHESQGAFLHPCEFHTRVLSYRHGEEGRGRGEGETDGL